MMMLPGPWWWRMDPVQRRRWRRRPFDWLMAFGAYVAWRRHRRRGFSPRSYLQFNDLFSSTFFGAFRLEKDVRARLLWFFFFFISENKIGEIGSWGDCLFFPSSAECFCGFWLCAARRAIIMTVMILIFALAEREMAFLCWWVLLAVGMSNWTNRNVSKSVRLNDLSAQGFKMYKLRLFAIHGMHYRFPLLFYVFCRVGIIFSLWQLYLQFNFIALTEIEKILVFQRYI